MISADGHGEIAFGAMQAGLKIGYGDTTAFFTWDRFDEMDEVAGSESAELRDDGFLETEFNGHLGDAAILTAVPVTSSTACYTLGRLTLNVLLSFAQFQREVAGERIRDTMRFRSGGAFR